MKSSLLVALALTSALASADCGDAALGTPPPALDGDASPSDAVAPKDAGPSTSNDAGAVGDTGSPLPPMTTATCPTGTGKSWYVRPSAQGTKDGTSWTNAWTTSSIAWASVSPGDVIWLAGGNYSTGITFQKSGASGNVIAIKRATWADTEATSAGGWNPAFDSQVVIAPAGGTPLSWSSPNGAGSYVCVDGRTANGISARYVNAPNAFLGAATFTGNGIHAVTLLDLDLAGPGGSTPFAHQGDNAPLLFRSSSPNTDTIYDIVVAGASIHGGPNLVYTLGPKHHITIQQSRLYDNGSSNSNIHANLIYNVGASDWTIANNDISGWQVEGIILYENENKPWYVYGNVFHDPMTTGARVFWSASPTGTTPQGPLFLYDNTFVSVSVTIGEGRASPFAAGSISRNNVFWNATFFTGSQIADSDYNYASGAAPGTHSISNGASPFVDLGGKNFHLAQASAARNKGTALAPVYAIDRDGTARGKDGAWDMGAYEAP